MGRYWILLGAAIISTFLSFSALADGQKNGGGAVIISRDAGIHLDQLPPTKENPTSISDAAKSSTAVASLMEKAKLAGLDLNSNPSDFLDPLIVEFFSSAIDSYSLAKVFPTALTSDVLGAVKTKIEAVSVAREIVENSPSDDIRLPHTYIATHNEAGIKVFSVFQRLSKKDHVFAALDIILRAGGTSNIEARSYIYIIFSKFQDALKQFPSANCLKSTPKDDSYRQCVDSSMSVEGFYNLSPDDQRGVLKTIAGQNKLLPAGKNQ